MPVSLGSKCCLRVFEILCSGLPNALGGYDETPEIMAAQLKVNNQL